MIDIASYYDVGIRLETLGFKSVRKCISMVSAKTSIDKGHVENVMYEHVLSHAGNIKSPSKINPSSIITLIKDHLMEKGYSFVNIFFNKSFSSILPKNIISQLKYGQTFNNIMISVSLDQSAIHRINTARIVHGRTEGLKSSDLFVVVINAENVHDLSKRWKLITVTVDDLVSILDKTSKKGIKIVIDYGK